MPKPPPDPVPTGPEAAAVLDWYAENARDLPWRAPGIAPWAVLVSEVMLQQTPVARVLPAYAAWLQRWPTPAALAAAPAGDAVRQWAKLGYPRRALRLHACAQQVVARFAGRLPADVAALRSLPGIGEYTAHAVAAFAFGQPQPVVDTNVRRVISRALAGHDPVGAVTRADVAAMAALLPDRAGTATRFAVAVMELGALVCTARAPRCPRCPLAARCAWRRAGYPQPAARPRAQAFAGTDRQVRGRLLDVLRASHLPVPAGALDLAWPDSGQRARALDTLVADGLVDPLPDGRYALPR